MKISKILREIKCDTILCNKDANYELELDSYKGNYFLCEKCFKNLQKLFKRILVKDE